MSEALRCRGFLLTLAWLGAPAAASAVELDGGYLEAAYARDLGGGPADGGPVAEGVAGAARLPISRNWFVAGSAQRFEPYVDSFGGRHEEEDRLAVGLGVRRSAQGRELFGQVTYLKYENWRQVGPVPRVEGGALSFGARDSNGPMEFSLEGGMGYVEGRWSHELLLIGRGSLAYRFAPHLWLYGEGTLALFDYTVVRAGLRFSFPGPQPARLPPAVKAAGPHEAAALALGANVVAQRPLQLQVRPAFGAPETIVVPEGGTLSLLETVENTFGPWWRVGYGEQQGWIREGHLK